MAYKFLSLELAISFKNTFTLVSGSFLISILVWQQFKVPFSKIWNPEVKGLAVFPAHPECLSQIKSELCKHFVMVFIHVFRNVHAAFFLSWFLSCLPVMQIEGRQVSTLYKKWNDTNRSPWRDAVSKDFVALASADGNQVLHQIWLELLGYTRAADSPPARDVL